MARDSEYQEAFAHFLTDIQQKIQQECPDITLDDVNIGGEYGIGRSFRRGADVISLDTRVPDPLTSAINLWQKIEQGKRTCPRFSMLEHYGDVVLMMDTILQFSKPI